MTVCETPDFMFPMQASLYHPIVEQGDFGAIKKVRRGQIKKFPPQNDWTIAPSLQQRA